MQTEGRKMDHILITLSEDVESSRTLFEDVTLVHQALPEKNFAEIDTSTDFLGKRISLPLMITGMTGGHSFAAQINKVIAKIAEEKRIAMGVGSQRAALEDPSLAWTFRIAREQAPSIPLIANIGAQQLGEDPLSTAEKAVEMIDADALAIHLNPGQELFQIEGDRNFFGLISKIKLLARELSVPIIVKETGCGISKEVAAKLFNAGVRYIDVSGAGGTNWIKVEIIRARRKKKNMELLAASEFENWGIPTAASIIEVRSISSDFKIIASGGIRSGLDIAKAISIGADLAGFALPALRAATTSEDSLRSLINTIETELKIAMMLTASGSIRELKSAPLVVSGALKNWVEQRGIEVKSYLIQRSK